MAAPSSKGEEEGAARHDEFGPPTSQAIGRSVLHEDEAGSVPYTRVAFGIPLYTYHQVPTFLKWNPGIKEGYRVGLPMGMCFRSLFVWNNESINIWTHFLGFLYFTFLMLEDNFFFLPEHKGEFGDHLTFTSLNFCFQICMLCSTGYHIFNCMSETVLKKWLHLDLGGVSVGLCGCYFPGVYYAFYCEKHCQMVYMVLLVIMAVVSMVTQLHPEFLSARWHLRRLFLYSAIMFAGIIPVVHWMVINGGVYSPIVSIFLPRIMVIYMLAVLGGTFYASRFPESMFPGKVDYIGSSHQWWHTFVLLAFVWTHHCAVVIFLYWRNNTCSEHAAAHAEFLSPQ